MVHCDTEIVSKVRALLEAELGEDRFELWFGTETRFEWTEQAFRIAADSSFRVERLRKSLHREIESVVQSVVGVGTSVEFRVDEQLATPFAPVTVKDSVQPRKAVPDAAIESLIPVRASGTQASLETRAAIDGPFPTGATGHRAMAGSRGRKFARFATLIRGAFEPNRNRRGRTRRATAWANQSAVCPWSHGGRQDALVGGNLERSPAARRPTHHLPVGRAVHDLLSSGIAGQRIAEFPTEVPGSRPAGPG